MPSPCAVSTRSTRLLASAFASLFLVCVPAALPAAAQTDNVQAPSLNAMPTDQSQITFTPIYSAQGNAVAAATAQSLTISPSGVNFNLVGIGTTSAAHSITVTNNTTSTAHFVSFTNLSKYNFNGGTCGALSTSTTLAAGASCTFTVSFSPTASGLVKGSFTVQAGSISALFQVEGYGVTAAVEFKPSTVSFGNVPVGTVSAPITVQVHNYAGVAATYVSSSSNLALFNFNTGPCGFPSRKTTVPPGATCSFTVQFAPTAPGSVFASFTVTAGSQKTNFFLSGTGQ